MTVLIVPSWYIPKEGAQLGAFFREQALALQKAGIDVIVADATLQSRRSELLGDVFKMKRFFDTSLLTYSYITPSFGLMRTRRGALYLYQYNLKKIFKQLIKDGVKIDLIHAHSFFPAGVASVRLGRKYNIPVVVTEHSSNVLTNKLSKSRRLLLKETVEQASVFICVSEKLKESVRQITSTMRSIEVIPNMVNSMFKPEECSSQSTFYFVSIGNLVYSKRFDLTLDAFARAFKGRTNIKLRIVGDGVLKSELERYARNLQISEQVEFMGKIERKSVAEVLQKSNAFLLPSDFETFGVVYIEALACGLPVIGTLNGGANEIIDDNNGILVDVNDVKQLSYAMESVYKDYEKYDKLELATSCKKKYGEERICHRITELYKTLLR